MKKSNKSEKYIQKSSEIPDNSFSAKRNIIIKHTNSLVGVLRPGYTPFVEYLDRLSHIPTEITNYVDRVLSTNRTKKTFHADKAYREICKLLGPGRSWNLVDERNAKRRSYDAGKRTGEWYGYLDDAKKSDLSLPYADLLHNDDGVLSKSAIYQKIYEYCAIVEKNVALYNENKSPIELLCTVFPHYKGVDFGVYEKQVQCSLPYGILTFHLPPRAMKVINEKDVRLSRSGFAHKSGVVVVQYSDLECKLNQAIMGSQNPQIDIIRHEAQHICNSVYQTYDNEDNDHVWGIDMLMRAKDEIIAQLAGGNSGVETTLVMCNGKSYNYFPDRIAAVDAMLALRKRTLTHISSKQPVNEALLHHLQIQVNIMQNIYNTLHHPEKIHLEKKRYYDMITAYIFLAETFVTWSKETGNIYDPYVILANTPMSKWGRLCRKAGIS